MKASHDNILFVSLLFSTVIHSSTSFSTTSSFHSKSHLLPNFDSFSSHLLGPWNTHFNYQPPLQEVTEVMRSCGGAVQGIRDLPCTHADYDEEEGDALQGPYHNRGHDGFVYNADGCYTNGPVNLDQTTKSDIFTCLMFPKNPAFRMVLTCCLSNVSSLEDGDFNMLSLRRPSPNCAYTSQDFDTFQADSSTIESIAWEECVTCAMPSLNQPWMIPRVQWRLFQTTTHANAFVDTAEKTGETIDDTFQAARPLQGWTQLIHLKDKKIDYSQDFTKAGILQVPLDTQQDAALVLVAGAVCTTSGMARAVVRMYNENGGLMRVGFQYGRLSLVDAKQ